MQNLITILFQLGLVTLLGLSALFAICATQSANPLERLMLWMWSAIVGWIFVGAILLG